MREEAGRGRAGRDEAGGGHRVRPARGGTNPGLRHRSRLATTNATVRFPKDLTRTTSGLLASRRSEGVPMLEPKTHFEQVPMEVVRKIVEEQIRREITTEQDQGSKKKTREDDLLKAQEQSIARSRIVSQKEL